jgi:hypothetical protein
VQSNARKSVHPPHTYPLFHHFCRPRISGAQNGLPRLTRWVCQPQLPLQHRYMALLAYKYGRPPTSCFPLPYCSRSIGYISSLTTFFSFPESTQDHIPPSCFRCHLQIVYRLYIAVLTLLSVALPFTLRLLPTCLVETRTCSPRVINLLVSGPLSITVSIVSN